MIFDTGSAVFGVFTKKDELPAEIKQVLSTLLRVEGGGKGGVGCRVRSVKFGVRGVFGVFTKKDELPAEIKQVLFPLLRIEGLR